MAVLLNGTNGLIQAYDYQTPLTGFSYTFAAGTQTLVMNPATTLAAGTITMPAAPSDGMTITFSSTQQITALTLNGNTGQTVVSGATSMPAGSSASYIYRSANTSWFPTQAVPTATNTQLGVGQTWQNMAGSRSANTTYTNSTGKPIYVLLTQNVGTSGELTVGGVLISSGAASPASTRITIAFIVPPGSTYIVTYTPYYWAELR
jgi:hypothetical protein